MCETSLSSYLRSTDPEAKINQQRNIFFFFFLILATGRMLIVFFLWRLFLGRKGGREGAGKHGKMNSTFMTARQGSICIQRFSSGECNVVGCITRPLNKSTYPIMRWNILANKNFKGTLVKVHLRKTERGQESTNRSDSSPLPLKERVHHPPGTGWQKLLQWGWTGQGKHNNLQPVFIAKLCFQMN